LQRRRPSIFSRSRVSGAAREANHVHRRLDEHRGRRNEDRLVISSSHRLPTGDIAPPKGCLIYVAEKWARGLVGAVARLFIRSPSLFTQAGKFLGPHGSLRRLRPRKRKMRPRASTVELLVPSKCTDRQFISDRHHRLRRHRQRRPNLRSHRAGDPSHQGPSQALGVEFFQQFFEGFLSCPDGHRHGLKIDRRLRDRLTICTIRRRSARWHSVIAIASSPGVNAWL
jgi:hypothetical protein